MIAGVDTKSHDLYLKRYWSSGRVRIWRYYGEGILVLVRKELIVLRDRDVRNKKLSCFCGIWPGVKESQDYNGPSYLCAHTSL